MEQRKKEEEERQKEEAAARQKLILAPVPGTRYIGTITDRDGKVQRLRLVFTEQKDFLIRAEVSNPNNPKQKQTFTGELVFNPQPEKEGAVAYPIVMSPVGGHGFGGPLFGNNFDYFYKYMGSLKLRLTETGLEGEAYISNNFTIRLRRGK